MSSDPNTDARESGGEVEDAAEITQSTPVRIPDEDPGSRTAAFLPVLGELTYNEVHAAYLGTCGLIASLAYVAGSVEETVGFSFAVIGVAFGIRVMPEDIEVPGANHYKRNPHPAAAVVYLLPVVLESAAARTIRLEPWYFVGVYLTTFLAGTGLAALFLGPI